MKPILNRMDMMRKLVRENDKLKAENQRLQGDVDFIAIMTDVDLTVDEDMDQMEVE